jgi:hypothetical protein
VTNDDSTVDDGRIESEQKPADSGGDGDSDDLCGVPIGRLRHGMNQLSGEQRPWWSSPSSSSHTRNGSEIASIFVACSNPFAEIGELSDIALSNSKLRTEIAVSRP